MSDDGYRSKWRCKECEQLYGYNPSKCEICGHTVFKALPADGVDETFEGGEQNTNLGADVSELVDRIEADDEEADNQVHSDKSDPQEESPGLLSRLLPWS